MAAEPTSAGSLSLTVLLVALLGPLGGEYAAIVFAALGGALWPLSTMKGTSKGTGAMFLLRVVVTAVALTGAATAYLESHYNFPARYGMTVVAFFIGAMGNGWTPVLNGLRDGATAFAGRMIGGSGNRDGGQQS